MCRAARAPDRFVTLPMIATALVAGGLLAFALAQRLTRDTGVLRLPGRAANAGA